MNRHSTHPQPAHLINKPAMILLIGVLVIVAGFKIAYSLLPTYNSDTENVQRELSDAQVVQSEIQSPDQTITDLLNQIRTESGITFSEPVKNDNIISITASDTGTIPEKIDMFFKSEGFFLVENQSTADKKYYSNDSIICQLKLNDAESEGLKIGCLSPTQ